MKYVFLTLIGLMFTFTSQAQLVVNFESADTFPTAGSTVNINVTVDNFVDINSLQFWIYWDSTVLAYDTITNFNPTLNAFDIDRINYPGNEIVVNGMTTTYPDGQLAVSWENGLNTQTLADGSTFFTISMTAVGLDCDVTDMTIGDNPPFGEIEVYANFDFAISSNLGATSPGLPFQIAGDCGQDPNCDFTFIVDDVQAVANEEVCVFISATGFSDIESFQTGIYYDNTVLQFTGFQFVNIPQSANQAVVESSPGQLSMLWIQDPSTVPNNTDIVKLTFDPIGDIGDVTTLTFGDAGALVVEVIAADGPQVVCNEPGTVTIVESIVETFTLTVEDANPSNNTNFCVPVTVNNFNSISTMQFKLQWDGSVMSYTGLQNLNSAIGINENNHFNQMGNMLIVSWSPPSAGGVSIPDGSTIFEVCYDIAGNCDQSYEIEILGNPDIEISAEIGGQIVQVPVITNDGTITINCSGDPCANTNIELSTVVTNVACLGTNTGSIVLTPSFGTAPYTCAWTTPTGPSSNCQQTNLGAGNYSVVVTDANGCTATTSVTVTAPTSSVSITGTTTPATCTAGGTISTTPAGGAGGYTFQWSGGLMGQNPTNVSAGSYSVVVSDSNNCTASTSFTVTSSSMVMIGGTSTNVTCSAQGSITPTYSGGSGNYAYCWSDLPIGPIDLPTRVGLNAGTYTITVKDNTSGCSADRTFTITDTTTDITIAAGNTTNISCSATSGSYTYTATGGCPTNGQYTCTLNGNPIPCTGAITGLAAGNSTLVVSDNQNNSATANITITNTITPLAIVGTVQTTDVSCNGADDGAVLGVNISGGCPSATTGYTCNISGVGSVDCEDIESLGLPAGNYTLTVSDVSGATATAPISINEPDPILIEEVSLINEVFGEGLIDISVFGGNGGYMFSWSNSATTEDIMDLGPGIYSLTVTDSKGCQAFYSGNIGSVLDFEAVTIASEANNTGFGVSCNGVCDAVIAGTQLAGSANYTVTLTNTATSSTTTFGSFPIEGICAGTYTLSAEDEFGAVFNWANPITVTQPDLLDITIDAVVNPGNNINNGSISTFITGGVGPYTYEWTPNVSSGLTANDLAAGTYIIEVVDGNDCNAIVQMDLIIESDDPCFEVNSVITPNGDGANDFLNINCVDSPDLVSLGLGVYDRWGRTVLESNDYNNDWAATDEDGATLTEGVYFYVFTLNFGNETRLIKGTVTLLRDQ